MKNFFGNWKGYDWIILISILMLVGANFITKFVLETKTSEITDMEVVKGYIALSERNPLMGWAIQFNKIAFLLHLFIVPAFVYGLFWFFKKSPKYNLPEILWSYAMVLFLIALTNFTNDLAVVLGMLARGGT